MKKVLVIGDRQRLDEFTQLSLQDAQIDYLDQFYLDLEEEEEEEEEDETDDADYSEDPYFMPEVDFSAYDILFDLSLDDHPGNLELYAANEGQVVFACAVKLSLAEMQAACPFLIECNLYGINAFPTFINRPLVEWSSLTDDIVPAQEALSALQLQSQQVADRVGMVGARVVCMIINEACFVLGEGTADTDAVDKAMKLGTNYPYGPFEWADKIGIQNVFELLDLLHDDTGDSRYKLAPALRHHYLQDQAFTLSE